MEHIFGIDCQPRYFRSLDAFVLRNHAGFGPIAVQAQAPEICGGELDLVPFEYDGGLGGVSAADDRRRGGSEAVGGED